ncbi:hypothetical protein BaRGS_00025819 [Batillaria attramentaria]|uniref:Major facilitator superfamily associated domain-containing protein n=1 Tax=Batillaria attramentaria TaxID=370345 RepID=A0ABD0K6G7_9CAEN
MSSCCGYLQHRGARPLFFGCAFLVGSLFETPVMVLSGRFIKRLGTVPCICIALGAMSLRMLGYSLLENPWLVLLIEPLHSLTFALMWAAVTTRASQIAPLARVLPCRPCLPLPTVQLGGASAPFSLASSLTVLGKDRRSDSTP